jgi:hypothetical protein
VTGRGTPNAPLLINDLLHAASTTTITFTATKTSTVKPAAAHAVTRAAEPADSHSLSHHPDSDELSGPRR